jgi:hypothetical protein
VGDGKDEEEDGEGLWLWLGSESKAGMVSEKGPSVVRQNPVQWDYPFCGDDCGCGCGTPSSWQPSNSSTTTSRLVT